MVAGDFEEGLAVVDRAALSLARLLRDKGANHDAREVLTPIYGSFTEGFDTADLQEAKALLEAAG